MRAAGEFVVPAIDIAQRSRYQSAGHRCPDTLVNNMTRSHIERQKPGMRTCRASSLRNVRGVLLGVLRADLAGKC